LGVLQGELKATSTNRVMREMKKALLAVFVICGLLASLIVGMQTAEAQSYQTITIKPDGSIEPDTDLLERNGTTYTFKGDIFGSIMVQTGYITIDGAGFTLQGQGGSGITLAGPDLSHRQCRGVLVENLRLYNCGEGIYSVGASNNSFIGNYFDKSSIHLMGSEGYIGDLLKHNTFKDMVIFADYNYGGLDVITENNFFNSGIFVDLADAPIVDKNYWNDYTAKYPDAKEVGNSGMWDTPYINASSDYHPLVNPIDFESPYFTNPTSTPTPPSSPTINPTTSLIIHSTMYAFHGSKLLCSFNATAGSWVELNMTLTGDNSYASTFEVTSNNNGEIFNATIYGGVGVTNFTQKINLNYDDAYNITVAKHPFCSTVTIKGTIDLYNKEAANYTPTPSPSIPEFPSIITVPILIASILAGTIIYKKKIQKTLVIIRCALKILRFSYFITARPYEKRSQ
jgi:parallel beta-helix repeat protein